MAGMRQRDLIQWYVSQQNEKNIYNSMEEAANEVSKIKAIIEVKLLFSCKLDPIENTSYDQSFYTKCS